MRRFGLVLMVAGLVLAIAGIVVVLHGDNMRINDVALSEYRRMAGGFVMLSVALMTFGAWVRRGQRQPGAGETTRDREPAGRR